MLMSFKSKSKSKSNIEILTDTHVPAYGYGKNHGWSRIIRIYRRLLPHSISLLKAVAGNVANISQDSIEMQVRYL